jgi:electron transfer flavoprotein alpha/beta subunit
VRKELGGARHADIEMELPALVCVQTGIQPRTYVPLARVNRARQQPIESLNPTDLGLSAGDLEGDGYQIVSVSAPAGVGGAVLVDGTVQEIASALLDRVREVLRK